MDCTVYRCGKQAEMYLYLRKDLSADTLPAPLLQRTGRLTEVMRLSLTPQRKLARADREHVIAQLTSPGYFLQMPPDGIVQANLHMGD